MQDVRSDDEDSDVEIEQKQGEGYDVGMSGGEASEKKALENGRPNGVNGINGKAPEGRGSRRDAVMEGKKAR